MMQLAHLSSPRHQIICLLLWLFFSNSLTFAKFHPPKGFTSSNRKTPPFKTTPKFVQQQFEVVQQVKDRSLLSPGYFFIDPGAVHRHWGSQIYDIDGTLIWHGDKSHHTQNIHVCDFQGGRGDHICLSSGAGKRPWPEKLNLPDKLQQAFTNYMVLDNTYRTVASYNASTDGLPFNAHVFQMCEGGDSFLGLLGKLEHADLTPYGGPQDGYIRNQCIDEVDTRTNKSLFRWCYTQAGLKLWESQVFPFNKDKQSPNATSPKAGTGALHQPWDFLHMNGLDKNEDGDYYMSVRYLDQIIKIAGRNSPNGKPGAVLWRLGGKGGTFSFNGFRSNEKPFSRAHDVRIISYDRARNEEVISLFNNGGDGRSEPDAEFSEGLIFRLNTKTMEATLVQSYPHPQWGKRFTHARGNMQVLPNGNIFVGWGTRPHMTEFSANGTVLYHATFYNEADKGEDWSYRAYKSPWVGNPQWDPDLLPYAETCSSPSITAYVAWNGATEVTHWRFFVAKSNLGPWIPAGKFSKNGFETKVTLHPPHALGFMSYVRVEALDLQGIVLGEKMQNTFVPKSSQRKHCGHESCKAGFVYEREYSRAYECSDVDPFPYILLVLAIICSEAFTWLSQLLIVSCFDEDVPLSAPQDEQSVGLISDLKARLRDEKPASHG